MESLAISDQEFVLFQRLIYRLAGINLTAGKKLLLVGRLASRLRYHGMTRFGEYYRLLASGDHPTEVQLMVDLLTTHETYFFREPVHFDFLREFAASRRGMPIRVWSGACSSGEEPYSIAMELAETLGLSAPWEIVASDISLTELERAKHGHYPLGRASGIAPELLKAYCLKGVRSQEGTFLIGKPLRDRICFRQLNLTDLAGCDIGLFDVIFLRNVMIYFDLETKRKVMSNMLPYLKRDGVFIVGHSETLNGITDELVLLRPTLYRRPESKP
ncbi:protein-glutamate O-methyltransferase CheR [Crenobacter sp. SG2303]|uniref:Chemotaxis protein methyltransferase n=1 Tax=Crenobacter oryzisoli TaxID=3056844 RepID=A0ABT7XTE7_9NEIS|nr:protein-glutamate O-methyltransferase CheR [Crenobacter sp. SG2303]MDN0077000.1 protein-glutamate O-methyltransferase CheR [Crenobacter sp. SG2303]